MTKKKTPQNILRQLTLFPEKKTIYNKQDLKKKKKIHKNCLFRKGLFFSLHQICANQQQSMHLDRKQIIDRHLREK